MRFVVPFAALSSLLATSDRLALVRGDVLVQPPTIDSSNGVLETTISLEYADFSGPHYNVTNARLLNGRLPGPTLRLSPGETLRVLFRNELSYQQSAVNLGRNVYQKPDHSNLHFHGGHVSGELPSDDVRMRVAPGGSFQYETEFPSDHMPGTHWIHPHMHGSSSLHVGAGAAGALIVKDPTGFLPSQVEDAEDVLLFVQNVDPDQLSNVVDEIQEGKLIMNFAEESPVAFRVVNGQHRPEHRARPGEWQRWRVVWANWLRDSLNLRFANGTNCEMHLLAKDGVYVQDYPRRVTVLPVPTGGRADVMVRCARAGTEIVQDFSGATLFTVSVSGDAASSEDLEPWTPDYPSYLSDLTSTPADDGCACQTYFTKCPGHEEDRNRVCINQNDFDDSVYLHKVALGSVVQRELRGVKGHPYHQHVYPYQLVGGLDNLSDDNDGQATYFQVGDWHDTVRMDTRNVVVVRYRPETFTGVIMLHCHVLVHEDKGAMSQELVLGDGRPCECDPCEGCS